MLGVISRALVVAFVASCTAACLDGSTIVRVNRDGSGTLELSRAMNVAMLRDMGSALIPGAADATLVSESDLRRQAERIGELKFVSSAPITTAKGFQGVRAVFAFRDIRALRLPSDVLIPSSPGTGLKQSDQDRAVTFTFSTTEASSTVTVRVPGTPSSVAPNPSKQSEQSADSLAAIKPFSDGMRLSLVVEVAGTIVRSNGDDIQGNRVTVFAFDFDELMKDEAKLIELSKKIGGSRSPSQMRSAS